ncbi:MAG: protein translocase subunit SecF [Bdellovibrionaceae bacterium]|nr:protein translocase subunit SecF [Pseudobdellovibrionaceae bacterium]
MKPNRPSTASQKESQGRFDFFALAPMMGGLSLLAMIISLGFIGTKGFNYGIDFAGGNEMQIKLSQPVKTDDLQTLVTNVGFRNASVQSFGESNEYLIRTEAVQAENEKEANQKLQGMIKTMEGELKTKFQLAPDGIQRVDTVGPQVGNELKRNGLLAAFYSFLVILIYVAMRFDYKYAPGAVICLVHDALLTLGVFSILGREVNVQIMAAVLTLIGYSLNDTIVTFDRIRETIPQYREQGLRFVINKAINDMLGRTLLTAGTTMLAVLALFIWGGGVIEDIAFTLLIGIIVGAYSSIYVAAPLVLVMEKLKKSPA